MKRSLPVTLFCLLSLLPLSAQHALELDGYGTDDERPFLLNANLDTGLFFGMIQEWVFYDQGGDGTYDFTESRIDWQVCPVFYVGLSGSIEILPRFFVALGAWIGIPGETGYMEDFDWNTTTGVWTNFSHHDNLLQSAQFADLNAGYSIVYESNLVVNALIGFNFQRFQFSGRDGYLEYPPGSVPVPSSGEAINYDVMFFAPYLGVETVWRATPAFSLDFLGAVSPFLTFAVGRDYHALLNDLYYDFPRFAVTLSGVLSVSVRLSDLIDLRVKNLVVWTPPSRSGDTYLKENGTDYFVKTTVDHGSASRILYSLSVSLSFRFYR
ncbi:MAG TPA: omptin family outer membrane protease [Spirochaetia bacterium]|nr:omptin family outer membrane protease [Spirochaetia bacterium]